MRESFCWDIYADFDIQNCQPEIICQLAEHHELPNSSLKKYCENRDKMIQETMDKYAVNKTQAKKLFTRLCFGGTFNGWKVDNDIEFKVKPTAFIEEYTRELNIIINKVFDENPDIVKQCKAKHKKFIDSFYTTDLNICKGEDEIQDKLKKSTMGVFSQHIECSIVCDVLLYLKNNTKLLNHPQSSTIMTGSYEYDGFRLLLKNVEKFKSQENDVPIVGIDAVLSLLNTITFDITGYKLIWKHKPSQQEDIVDLSPHINTLHNKKSSQDEIYTLFEDFFEGDDTARCDEILNHCKDEIFFQESKNGGVWFIWDAEANNWCQSNSIIRSKIIKNFCEPIEEYMNGISKAYETDYETKKNELENIKSLFTKKEMAIYKLGSSLIRRAKSTSGMNSTIKMMEKIQYIKHFERDNNIHYLGFLNGFMDFQDKTFKFYKPQHRITIFQNSTSLMEEGEMGKESYHHSCHLFLVRTFIMNPIHK